MCLLFHVTTSTELIYIPYFLCFEKLNAWFHLISFQWCFSSRMPLFSQYTKHKSFVFLVILYFVICSFAFNLCLACCHSLFSPFIGHYAEYCFFSHVCKKKKKKSVPLKQYCWLWIHIAVHYEVSFLVFTSSMYLLWFTSWSIFLFHLW